MAQIIGFQRSTMTYTDRNNITQEWRGYRINLTEPFPDSVAGAEGFRVASYTVSDVVLEGYVPHLGDEIICNTQTSDYQGQKKTKVTKVYLLKRA